MEWFIAVLAVVVIGLAVVVATGRLGQLGPIDSSGTSTLPPPGEDLTADDVAQVRFRLASPGYAVDQVDDLLSRLAAQLEAPARPASPKSGIMDLNQSSDRRNHDGSDETSHG